MTDNNERENYTITIERNDGTFEQLHGCAKLRSIMRRYREICRSVDFWMNAREISWRYDERDPYAIATFSS